MRAKLLVGIILAAVIFLAGWYPQYQRRSACEEMTASIEKKLADTGQSLALARLRSRTALLWERSERNDYGAAGTQASEYFTDLRSFTNSLPAGDLRQALETLLGHRDSITAGLAKADSVVKQEIRMLFLNFPEQ